MSIEMTNYESGCEAENELFSASELEEMEKSHDEFFDDEPAYDEIDDCLPNSCLAMFLKDISKVPLLTQEEETELAKRAAAGDKAATDKLVESNIRLVISVCKKYRGCGVELDDLIMEGVLGLMRGIQKFDYSKGFRLSTYATWWIRQACARTIGDHSRSIRIPVHMAEKASKLNRERQRLSAELGYEPDQKTIAASMGISRREIVELMNLPVMGPSLETTIGEEDDMTVADTVKDKSTPVDVLMEREDMRNEVLRMLDVLSDREREVVEMRFGLVDGETYTLEAVGNKFGISRERVRQIETVAIRKLRRSADNGLAS